MSKIILATVAALSMTAAAPALAQQQSAVPQGQTQAQSTSQAANPSKDEIRQAQQVLNDKGFKAGRTDGMMGPQTRQALRDFQGRQRLQANGQLDGATLAALGMKAGANAPSSPKGAGTVGQGGNSAPKSTAPSSNPPSQPQGSNQSH